MLKIMGLVILFVFQSLFVHAHHCTDTLAFTLSSKRQSDRPENRGKIFLLKDQPKGILINGKFFPEYEFRYLPKTNIPVGVLSPKQPAKARIILLHGLGYEISTIFSLMTPGLVIHKITEGITDDPYSKWFDKNLPNLKIPLEIVIADVPPMGWTKDLEHYPNMKHLSDHFRLMNEELNESNPLKTFYVCRSASCNMGLLAGHDQAGVVMTGATFASPSVLDLNIEEMKRLQAQDNISPNWKVIAQVVSLFLDPIFLAHLNEVKEKDFPILSLIGSEDRETPEEAQILWAEFLNVSKYPKREQHIIKGAAHQVFKRAEGASQTFSENDSDIQALKLLIEFLKKHI